MAKKKQHKNPETFIYIASSLQNWQRVRKIYARLVTHNIHPTYDWTPHGEAIYGTGKKIIKEGIPDREKLGEIGWNEYKGVLDAQYLLAVMPGERGTHVEIGAFYMKYVKAEYNIDGPDEWVPPDDLPMTILGGEDTAKRPTSFHHMPGIKYTECEGEAISNILRHLNIKDIEEK